MKKLCGMRDSREKDAGMRDQDPLPDPVKYLITSRCNIVFQAFSDFTVQVTCPPMTNWAQETGGNGP